ncbi:MAG: nuclear transport factor 2 family protein [Burkholderiales bacterium]|nr:nuclear transport factor 2 family protein [Burkholderiales bacterium]
MSMFFETAHQYFRAFAAKDAVLLRTVLADNVSLRDWEQNAQGLTSVLAVNQALFDAVGTIQVTPLRLFADGQALACELEIAIDGNPPLKVLDILEFDKEGKIFAVRAFKG